MPKVSIENNYQYYTVTSRPKRNWLTITFLILWLLIWAAGEYFVLSIAFSEGLPPAPEIYLILWLVGWTMGGILAIISLLWNLIGKEVVIIGYDTTLTIIKKLFFLKKAKVFFYKKIRNIRIEPKNERKSHQIAFLTYRYGKIKFAYKRKVYGFGSELTEAQAQEIVDRMNTLVNT